MARYEMPDGSVYDVKDVTVDHVESEFVLPDGCVAPPPHVHPAAAEEYEVVEGAFEVMVEGTWRSLGPGEQATVPAGALHTFRNRSGARVRVRNWHRPGAGFDMFIEDMWSTLRAAGVTRRRDPRVYLLLSKVMLDHPETLVPGRARERIPMRIMARAARFVAR